jgi:hypothetical protein
MRTQTLGAFALALLLSATPSSAADWFVAPGGTGSGTSVSSPFGRIQDAIDAAQPGDVVNVAPGTYSEVLRTMRHGTSSQRIIVRATGSRGSVLVTSPGRVLTARHAWFTVERLVLDGQYGLDDLVVVDSAARGFTLRDSEVRRSSKDGIDIRAAEDVLIEGSLIHRALNAAGGRTDAHAIVAGAVRRLTIRNTEMHTFSGDAFQVDPGRSSAGWTDVLIEGCRMWLAPLAVAENGFAAGVVPGENAVDTKANGSAARAKLTIRDTVAYGFRNGLISNMAAFNLKENVDVVLDRVTVYDSQIAFRTRGPGSNGGAWVHVQNAVIYNTDTVFRYEDNIEQLRVWNVTLGGGVSRPFQSASSSATVPDVRNFLLLGSSLPWQASHPSNLAVGASAFVDASAHDYQLSPGSPAVDRGDTLAGVPTDRLGVPRPQGSHYDVGGFERPAAPVNQPPVVTIASPATGASFVAGSSVSFSGSALDPEDGNLSAELVWVSTVDGPLGTGGSFSRALSAGSHIISASVTDREGLYGFATVTVTVTSSTPPPPPETDLWLSAEGETLRNTRQVRLTWGGAASAQVDVYRDGKRVAVVANSGAHVDQIRGKASKSYAYQVCEAGSAACSNTVVVTF